MRLRLLAALIGLALATGAAQAQIGVYITPTASRISNSTPDTGEFAFLGPNNTSLFFKGAGFGAYDDFFHSKSFDAGVDARINILRGGGAQLTNFLIGGRLVFKVSNPRIRPYVEVSGGVGGSRPAHNPLSVSKAQYNVAGGFDYRLSRHVDFRAVEIGYGSLQTVNSSTVTTSATAPPASNLINLSTGLVFRFR